MVLFAIQQKYDFSSKSQLKATFGKAHLLLFAIQQKYDFSSKSQLAPLVARTVGMLFAIQQKYDFSSKSQRQAMLAAFPLCCLQYSKSTIFQANHNSILAFISASSVVCNTAKVRFFKQITTVLLNPFSYFLLFAIQQKYDFSSKSQRITASIADNKVVCNTAKVRFFKQITTIKLTERKYSKLFAIQQKYDFSSKSQLAKELLLVVVSCLQYSKSTIFQANHNCHAVW